MTMGTMAKVSCPKCGHSWECRSSSGRTRCRACRAPLRVPVHLRSAAGSSTAYPVECPACGHRWQCRSSSGRTRCAQCDARVYVPVSTRRRASLRRPSAPAAHRPSAPSQRSERKPPTPGPSAPEMRPRGRGRQSPGPGALGRLARDMAAASASVPTRPERPPARSTVPAQPAVAKRAPGPAAVVADRTELVRVGFACGHVATIAGSWAVTGRAPCPKCSEVVAIAGPAQAFSHQPSAPAAPAQWVVRGAVGRWQCGHEMTIPRAIDDTRPQGIACPACGRPGLVAQWGSEGWASVVAR